MYALTEANAVIREIETVKGLKPGQVKRPGTLKMMA